MSGAKAWKRRLPTLEGAFDYLRRWLPASLLQGVKAPEGLIARTPDRSVIRKLRFQDYERTFRKQGK